MRADAAHAARDADIARHLEHLQVERRLARAHARALRARRSSGCSASPPRPASPLRDGRRRARAPLGRAAARAAASRRARSRSSLSAWRGFYRWLGRAGAGRRATRWRACARRSARASRCRRRCAVDHAVRARGARDDDGRPALEARDAASSSCSTAAACASASWSGSTCVAERRGRRLDRRRPSERARARQGQQAPHACRSGAPALAGARARGCALRAAAGARRRAGALRQQPRHAPHREPGALAAEARAHRRRRCRRTCIRTCCATRSPSHVLQSSGDLRAVQELLGHANIATTQVYTQLDFGHLSKVYDAAHPRARRATGKTATSKKKDDTA